MWSWAVFVPHPPIIIPEVGRGEEKAAAKTLEGMQRICSELEDERPESLVVLTPHHVMGKGLSIICGESIAGDMGMFRARECKLQAEGDLELATELAGHVKKEGLPVTMSTGKKVEMDHASFVPLYYLNKAWKSLPKLVLANPLGLSYEQSYFLGRALRRLELKDKKVGIVFSGDLSHRLIPGAPAGYHPRAKEFDALVVKAFETSSTDELLSLSEDQIESAGECGLRSALAFLGMVEGEPIRLFTYEGPFGVGYCTALWEPAKGRGDIN